MIINTLDSTHMEYFFLHFLNFYSQAEHAKIFLWYVWDMENLRAREGKGKSNEIYKLVGIF